MFPFKHLQNSKIFTGIKVIHKIKHLIYQKLGVHWSFIACFGWQFTVQNLDQLYVLDSLPFQLWSPYNQ